MEVVAAGDVDAVLFSAAGYDVGNLAFGIGCNDGRHLVGTGAALGLAADFCFGVGFDDMAAAVGCCCHSQDARAAAVGTVAVATEAHSAAAVVEEGVAHSVGLEMGSVPESVASSV